MKLEWVKCGRVWCQFQGVNLANSHFDGLSGVYVIWSGIDSVTVYVGQGNIAERIRDHRKDKGILAYSHRNLLVTWAEVDSHNLDGVERFLIDQLNPRVGERKPNAYPIQVNLPRS